MDFDNKKPSNTTDNQQVPSNSELLSSAKVVAEAAKSTLNKETEQQVDKGKVAGAASDLLGAASRYGKLEEKGYGNYVEKAEDYLRQYGSSQSTTTSSNSGNTTAGGGAGKTGGGGDDGRSSDSGGGYGDYLKMAQGFLNKN